MKVEYCKDNNILLQIIKYTDYDNITINMLLENKTETKEILNEP